MGGVWSLHDFSKYKWVSGYGEIWGDRYVDMNLISECDCEWGQMRE